MSDDAHDLAAEQSLLGSVITEPEIAGPALLAVPQAAWWLSRHGQIAAVITDRLRSGKPVDLLLVGNDLLGRHGFGADTAPYLHTLVTHAWNPGNASTYADRVLHCAARRNLAGAATRLRQRLDQSWSNGWQEPVADFTTELRHACDEAEQADGGVQGDEPSLSLTELLAGRDTHDWLVPGLLERGERIILTGTEGLGKALALDTPIPTPKGWVTMGDLSVGDEVFSSDGAPVRIIAATDVMHGRPCYRVRFSDGAEIVADANHLWLTETLAGREAASRAARRLSTTRPRGTDQRHKRLHFPAVVTTQGMAETLHARAGHALNHSVATTAPLRYPAQELPIPPYVLGAWLGDGTSRWATITCADPEILEQCALEGEPTTPRPNQGPYAHSWAGPRGGRGDVTRMQVRLRMLEVLNNKHIPRSYLRASPDQRLALLQGLMDTDGTVGIGTGAGRGEGAATCEFSVCSERLARDVLELLLGLGVKVTWREGPAMLEGRQVGTRYRLAFQTDLEVFRLSRKAERLTPLRTRRAKLRYVTAVEPIESVPVRCVQVEREDGMFVVGRECIPTHNSWMISQFAACLAAGRHPFTGETLGDGRRGLRVLVVDCENGVSQSRRRFRRIANMVSRTTDWQDNLRIELRPNGLNLLGADASWLERKVAANAPDLVVVGPLYRLHYANMNDEQAARELIRVLDTLRTRHGCALVSEAHPGHANDGQGDRLMRPAGSSLFLRWPEFGYGLRRAKGIEGEHPNLVDVVAWRGSREERAWPKQLQHGSGLPWEPADPEYWDRPAA